VSHENELRGFTGFQGSVLVYAQVDEEAANILTYSFFLGLEENRLLHLFIYYAYELSGQRSNRISLDNI
jgi:hypothetical protein